MVHGTTFKVFTFLDFVISFVQHSGPNSSWLGHTKYLLQTTRLSARGETSDTLTSFWVSSQNSNYFDEDCDKHTSKRLSIRA